MPKLAKPWGQTDSSSTNGQGDSSTNGHGPTAGPTEDKLRAYLFHGLANLRPISATEAQADCPFCGKEKFHVSRLTGLWQCKSCTVGVGDLHGGNVQQFLQLLWEYSVKATSNEAYAKLARERKLGSGQTVCAWGLAQSILCASWLAPAYDAAGAFHTLYRWEAIKDKGGSRMALLATPGVHPEGKGHGLFGMNLHQPLKEKLYICEGLWDGMAWWETMRAVKLTSDGVAPTGAIETSLLANANVIAVPGCYSFHRSWAAVAAGKKVWTLFDNDHPKESPTAPGVVRRAGRDGSARICVLLATADQKPKEVGWLAWGADGWDAALPDGWDVRDQLAGGGQNIRKRGAAAKLILDRLAPAPTEWFTDGRAVSAALGGAAGMASEVYPLPCTDWKVLQAACKRAMEWTPELNGALAVMLASAMSVRQVGGDPIWLKVVGPPSCGKTTLAEAMGVARDYIYCVSTMTSFHSGYKDDPTGEKDHSLLTKILNKSLIVKDGDTLLSAPNKDKILSEARDLFDGVARTHYANGIARFYSDVRITWILCGTESLRALDGSELGERFLDYVVMDSLINEDFERTVCMRNVRKSMKNLSMTAGDTAGSRCDADTLLMQQLTGGYVEYLRTNAACLLREVRMPKVAEEKICQLAYFVANMRARPSKRQDESQGREFSARLSGQLTKLGGCLAAVLGKKIIDDEVIRLLVHVAVGTSRGRSLNVVKLLMRYGNKPEGLTEATIARRVGEAEEKLSGLLRFLRAIGVLEYGMAVGGPGQEVRYRVGEIIADYYTEIMSNADIS